LVEPRGLHLDERHIIINNEKLCSLVDFGLYVFQHTKMLQMELHLYFYLPKLEHYLEALVEQSV
jgi:malate synthase